MQIKRWAASSPGWAITSLFMTASKFDSAPTGSSTIMRFLKPKGSPEPAAHGPALHAAEASGQAGTVCRDASLAAASSAEDDTHGSTPVRGPATAEALHSSSGGQMHNPAVAGAAYSWKEGHPIVQLHPLSMQLEGSASHGVEDASSKHLHMSDSTSMSHGHEPQQHLLEEPSRSVPAHELPHSPWHNRVGLQQVPEDTGPAEAVQACSATNEMLHGSACVPSGQDRSDDAHQAEAALQHVQAAKNSELMHSDAAVAGVAQGVAREGLGFQHPDSRMAGDNGDGRNFQAAVGSIGAEMEVAHESRHPSMSKVELDQAPLRPGQMSYQVRTHPQ